MSPIAWFAVVAACLMLIGIVSGLTSSGGAYDEDDPNQFVRDELDPLNPNNLMLRNHHDDEAQDNFIHAIDNSED
ncbi:MULTISPECIES: hypothetical protein [Polaromonas]|uniref:Secreted protein n=1 Tax=Polaromonas aquatica TaxID=332657 RepID=A0ABW1TZD6_9BURK